MHPNAAEVSAMHSSRPRAHAPARLRCHRARRTLAAGTAAAALALAAASTAAPAASAASAAEGGEGGGGPEAGQELTLTPARAGGGGGGVLGVRAVCEAGGSGGVVSSPAFERTVALERADDHPALERHATASLREGLAVGGSYPVVAVCGTGELLSASFTHTGVGAEPGAGSSPGSAFGGAAGLAGLTGLAAGAVLLRHRAGALSAVRRLRRAGGRFGGRRNGVPRVSGRP
ncbi:hypothetical protein IQ279_20650 [Streptomyces verrucosisporus]|uniref:hypothetical protein n=1 Tax=Streptomyces verrucosisporus TaxID=1695161 RepID=UPI0019CFE4F3|nr:hypothetical protein [Streptomyces verrucosisporus]MBN3932008.1 hypothetical protein [Streptomyces verrucosisporus]